MITGRCLAIVLLANTAASLSAAPSVSAQQLLLRPQPSTVWAAANLTADDRVATAVDTVEYPPSHWREGLLVGGVAGALFGALLGGGLCSDSGIEQNCTGEALRGSLMMGATGASLGALIGGLFPKRSETKPYTPAERPNACRFGGGAASEMCGC